MPFRKSILTAAILALLGVASLNATAADTPSSASAYRLHLYHLHTGESIDVVYRVGDRYIPKLSPNSTTSCATTVPATPRITMSRSSIYSTT